MDVSQIDSTGTFIFRCFTLRNVDFGSLCIALMLVKFHEFDFYSYIVKILSNFFSLIISEINFTY